MSKISRHLYIAGSLGVIAVAGMHTTAHLASDPDDPRDREVFEMLQRRKLTGLGLGWEPSLFAVQQSLSLTMGVLLAAVGIYSILAFRARREPELPPLGPLQLNIITVGALLALYVYYRIPPPVITLAVVQIFFVLSYLFRGAAARRLRPDR